MAFSSKVSPVSSTWTATPRSAGLNSSNGAPARSARNSAILCGLVLARTRRCPPVILLAARRPLPSGRGKKRRLPFLIGVAVPALERPTVTDRNALHRASARRDIAGAGGSHCEAPDVHPSLDRGQRHHSADDIPCAHACYHA